MNIKQEKEKIRELEKEKRLIILLSRVTFSENIVSEIGMILKEKNFNWFEFYQYALYHKVITLCCKNLNNLFPDIFQPKYVREIVNAAYLGLIERNKLYQKEVCKIIKLLNEQNIKVIPVKGSYLIPNIYKDYGLRYSGDADFLIRYEELNLAEKILKKRGYIKGNYNYKDNCITTISRKEDIKWKTFMSNNHPLVKVSETKLFPVYKIDFRFALDDRINKDCVNEIIDDYINYGVVKPSHYLMHLCAHFYDEAKHLADIFLAKDMNIIKLCDIREYIIQATSTKDLEELIDFAKRYDLEQQVYYTMIYLLIIYNDGYELSILEKLDIEDETFLYTVGDSTLKCENINDLSIVDRLFLCGKSKEKLAMPKLFV